jgi:gliding motility-associated-like protein
MPIANQPPNLFVCDDESNDGKAVFDLSQQDDSILGLQDEADFVITYYSNINDAQSGLNALSTNFTTASNEQIIYGRIENKLSSTCFAVTSFTLFVKPKPILLLSDSYSICEGKTITVSAPLGFSGCSWSNGNINSMTTFDTADNYSLTVTNDYGDITCSTIKNVVVYNSNIATITKIITTDWTDSQNSITVEVGGDGDYEYSLNEASFQSSATFSGLRSGDYTVCVNDKKGCGFICEDVFLLNYPKFFTPNGDGYNDVWKIKNSFVEPNMQLKLFDRYGKLLSVFDGLDKGWDGTFNGTLLPADDYWSILS